MRNGYWETLSPASQHSLVLQGGAFTVADAERLPASRLHRMPRAAGCALPLPADFSAGLRTSPGLCVDCVRQPPPVDATLVAVNYGYPWARLVSAYKFGNKPGWAGFFASHFLTAPGVHYAFAALQPGDLVLPVPLSTARLESRGFNPGVAAGQSADLAVCQPGPC